MIQKKDLFWYVVSLALGVLVLLWGYMNLFPIERMENRLVEEYLCNWYTAPILARIFIALNFITGLFLILKINPGNMLPKALLATMGLVLFDLGWEALTPTDIISSGYSRFFGTGWTTSVMICSLIVFTAMAMWKLGKSTDFKLKWVKYPLGIVLFSLPFILNPVYPDDLMDQSVPVDSNLDLTTFEGLPESYLTKDQALINLYSTNCPYCLNAIRRLGISRKQSDHYIPVFIGFIGSEEGVSNFFRAARVEFEYSILEIEQFYQFSGKRYPSFLLLTNGVAVSRWDGSTFNYHTLQGLMN